MLNIECPMFNVQVTRHRLDIEHWTFDIEHSYPLSSRVELLVLNRKMVCQIPFDCLYYLFILRIWVWPVLWRWGAVGPTFYRPVFTRAVRLAALIGVDEEFASAWAPMRENPPEKGGI